jgi:Holliday junction resolvase-like predicted endonuclease
VRWDDLHVGEEVWSQDEFDPNAPATWKRVEEIFQTEAFICALRVAGQEIKTTGEHPFWVQGKGWTPVSELQPGDLLRGDDGQLYPVESVTATDEWLPVYNARIADYHTYYVCAPEGRVWIWAHNQCAQHLIGNIGEHLAKDKLIKKGWTIVNTLRHGRQGIDIIAQRIKNGKVISTIIAEVKTNGGRLSKYQQHGATSYALRVMERLKDYNLDAAARKALDQLRDVLRTKGNIPGVIIRFDWRSGVLRGSVKPW